MELTRLALGKPRMKHTLTSLLVATLGLVVPSIARGGDIEGAVTDVATGNPLRGAQIEISGRAQSVLADGAGRFLLRDLPAGTYELVVTFVGFETRRVTVAVPETGRVSRDVVLEGVATSETVVVRGFRSAQSEALQRKLHAATIKEVATANDIGKLSDQNAAEALQRLPGVSITLDQGEGRYVILRGIDPGLNSITIDGAVIGSPESNRLVALDTIPSDVLASLEVVKTVTPDMDGNAVGGSINLVTPSAFDEPTGQLLKVAAEIGYYDLNGENPTGANVTWSRVFGADGTFGLLLSASHSRREYESENVQGNTWEEEGGFFIPDELVMRDYTLERIRDSIVANLEWRPSEKTSIYWRNIWNEFEDTEQRIETVLSYREGDLVGQTPTSGTFTEGEGARASKDRREKQSILNSTLGGEFLVGDWTIDAAYTYGKTEQDTPYDNEWAFELAEGLPMSYDVSQFFFNVDGGAAFSNSANFEFDELELARQLVEEDLDVFRLDFKRDVWFGDNPGFLKFGAKLISREKTSDQEALVYDGFDGDLLLTQVDRPGKRRFYCSERCYEIGPAIDHPAANAFFRNNFPGFELNEDDSREVSAEADYRVEEDIAAGYLMGSVDFRKLSLTGGVRVERTDADFSAPDIVFEDGDLAPEFPIRRGAKDYTNWLPGLLARWTLRDNVLVRGAWTNTLGRAPYEDLVPFRIFEIEPDGGAFEGQVEEGNPDLDPLESMNLDFAVEWYMKTGGILALAAFYKDIDNPIFTRVTTLENVEFEGRFFSELERSRPENAVSGDILGLEINYQQQFRALPSPFDGFGVSLNYTWIDSEARVFGRDDRLPFFLQSDQIGNAAIFWEKHGFEIRAAIAYRSEYLDEVGDDKESDIYVDDRHQVDLKASYDFNNGLTLFLEVLNITDEPLRVYSGRPGRLAENEIYSWNALLGAQYRF
jgi:TonB-dependent receptor